MSSRRRSDESCLNWHLWALVNLAKFIEVIECQCAFCTVSRIIISCYTQLVMQAHNDDWYKLWPIICMSNSRVLRQNAYNTSHIAQSSSLYNSQWTIVSSQHSSVLLVEPFLAILRQSRHESERLMASHNYNCLFGQCPTLYVLRQTPAYICKPNPS